MFFAFYVEMLLMQNTVYEALGHDKKLVAQSVVADFEKQSVAQLDMTIDND